MDNRVRAGLRPGRGCTTTPSTRSSGCSRASSPSSSGRARHEGARASSPSLPRGVAHTFANRGDAPARTLIVCTPAGFERHFARIAADAGGRRRRPRGRCAPVPPVTTVGPQIGREARREREADASKLALQLAIILTGALVVRPSVQALIDRSADGRPLGAARWELTVAGAANLSFAARRRRPGRLQAGRPRSPRRGSGAARGPTSFRAARGLGPHTPTTTQEIRRWPRSSFRSSCRWTACSRTRAAPRAGTAAAGRSSTTAAPRATSSSSTR